MSSVRSQTQKSWARFYEHTPYRSHVSIGFDNSPGKAHNRTQVFGPLSSSRTTPSARYLVFAADCDQLADARVRLAHDFRVELWRPSLTQVIPPGEVEKPLYLWWLFHHGRAFSNGEYGALIIHHGGLVVHRSMIFPRYFTFPFMGRNDLQIGHTWTAPAYRGRGLAKAAMQEVLERTASPRRRIWYICDDANIPSAAVARAAGMHQLARAERRSRGLKALGYYALVE
jgi:RimJ/RimL family protein N-acetyltransferase